MSARSTTPSRILTATLRSTVTAYGVALQQAAAVTTRPQAAESKERGIRFISDGLQPIGLKRQDNYLMPAVGEMAGRVAHHYRIYAAGYSAVFSARRAAFFCGSAAGPARIAV